MQSQPAFSNSGIGERYCLVVKNIHSSNFPLDRRQVLPKLWVRLPRGAGTRWFAFIKAHLSLRCPLHLIPGPLTLVRAPAIAQ